jgi:hypothetical protein
VLSLGLVWLLISEIGRAQRRAGIDVNATVTMREVLLAKIGVGIGISHAAGNTAASPAVQPVRR